MTILNGAPVAIIDLGTNTFHLLIAKVLPDGSFEELYRERRFVKLASEGIQQIGPQPLKRAMEAMSAYKEKIEDYKVGRIRALGTAALRMAENSPAFVREVKEKLGMEIEVIDGMEEARLIAQGVTMAIPDESVPLLIMDIGGGSVEFILVEHKKVLWKRSFPLGVAILYREFHKEEPLSEKSKTRLLSYLKQVLVPLQEQLSQIPVKTLVGASGTFDVLEAMTPGEMDSPHSKRINRSTIEPIRNQIISLDLDARRKLPEMPVERAEMIVVAFLLVDYVLELSRAESVLISRFAMKEGALAELM